VARDLPINPRIVEQMAKSTVKNLIDGIVELVTNSDDSYRRIALKGGYPKGKIVVRVKRKKGGKCVFLSVKDEAEGMSKEELLKALEFAGETSGFTEGRSVRGLFGRGLKETIIALGRGRITSVKDRIKVSTEVWFDKTEKKPKYDDVQLAKIEKTDEANGTLVEIFVDNPRIKIPSFRKFKEQLSTHFALRDIISSSEREIILIFEDETKGGTPTKYEEILKFSYPEGRLVVSKYITMPNYEDTIRLEIYKVEKPLESPRNNPFGLAGILIKISSAILDNQLFKFDNETAAFYFYGQALCPGLEERLRSGETELIDPNRGGLEWKHDYNRTLAEVIERELEPLVTAKKKELEESKPSKIASSTKKALRSLCEKLNRLAKKELEEADLFEFPSEPTPEIDTLTIKPEKANIPYDGRRVFSVYAPVSLILTKKTTKVQISSDTYYIEPEADIVNLRDHPKYPQLLYYGSFAVKGKVIGAKGKITAMLKDIRAVAFVEVKEMERRKRGKLKAKKGGIFVDIVPDLSSDPLQRVLYDDGIIRIFVKFPSVSPFLGPGLKGIEKAEGRMLLAELVGEAFCKYIATKKFEIGDVLYVRGSEIDSFFRLLYDLQRKYLPIIQEIIFKWNL